MSFPNREKSHLYKYDNMRFLLLFLVIIGHSMELYGGQWVTIAYRIIYSFHMPAFLYLAGKFARFKRRKIFRYLIITYFVFQTAFILFARYVLCDEEIVLQYTTPYWVMWFLLAMIIYYVLIPMFPEKGTKESVIFFVSSIVIALLTGYEKTIGYYMSLSRTIVFLPFFLGGYYSGTGNRIFSGKVRTAGSTLLATIIMVAGEIYIYSQNVPNLMLYGSAGYESAESNLQARLVLMLTAAAAIILLEVLIPEKKIPVLSVLGQNTMPVFLAHAFIMRLAGKYQWFHYTQVQDLALASVMALLIMIIFGNPYVGNGFKKIFT